MSSAGPEPFAGAFRGRRVLVTGHTGFKGSWLSEWLLLLGAHVSGIALPPDDPSAFLDLGLGERLDHRILDIRDADGLSRRLAEIGPEVVFHLAAQALVRRSYAEPALTWTTNVGGSVNLLEAVRTAGTVRAVVVVTSDKCYENRGDARPFREDDPLGGSDPYSASKAATELVVASYRRSLPASAGIRLATARAGNVVGGGDGAQDRLVPDFVRAALGGTTLALRNPAATRPWQHVLEPLAGYLQLAARLLDEDGDRYATAFNFGPPPREVATVSRCIDLLRAAWPGVRVEYAGGEHPPEAPQLSLDSSRAAAELGWRTIWPLERTLDETVAWYRARPRGGMAAMTRGQIAGYTSEARSAGLPWAAGRGAGG